MHQYQSLYVLTKAEQFREFLFQLLYVMQSYKKINLNFIKTVKFECNLKKNCNFIKKKFF